MPTQPRKIGGWLEFLGVVLGLSALTIALTYPLAFNLGTLGYKLDVPGDAQYSVWNVAWVGHALLTEPWHVLDANIFYPHRWTLIYSEANLVAGVLGMPALWLTNNAYAAHNSAVLLSFVLSGTCTYYLVRYLTHDRRAAIVGAICFAYCPYAFGHLPHIQLLMTAFLPLSMLAFHRLVDRPTTARGLALGAAMAAQALACGYYAVFVALLIGFSVLMMAGLRGLWLDKQFWKATGVAALIGTALVAPLYIPYLMLQRETGFGRALEESARYSATWSSYLTSAAYLSSWMHPHLPKWSDVLFPGYIATIAGPAWLAVALRRRHELRDVSILYGSVGALALWESFGPQAGLYSATYYVVPAFTFLRAPSRFGVLVVLALTVLASMGIARLLARASLPSVAAFALIGLATVTRVTPIPLSRNPDFPPVYQALAAQPPGAVVELPLYSHTSNFYRTQYMLASTVHWKPLVNAYSDVIPHAFSENRDTLGLFPTRESFRILEADDVRYAIFHLREYPDDQGLRRKLEDALQMFGPYLRLLHADDEVWLYEIVRYPE
jgi:hypothetical protein